MNTKECEWANKNELLQKELRNTLRSALQDTEIEEHSLTSLEQVNHTCSFKLVLYPQKIAKTHPFKPKHLRFCFVFMDTHNYSLFHFRKLTA